MAKTTEEDKQKTAPTGESDIRSVVENANAEDENRTKPGNLNDDDDELVDDDEGDDNESDAADDDANADDTTDNDGDADDDNADDDKSKSKQTDRAFSQFAGDGTDESYISNLEKGYKNSSQEALKFKTASEQTQGRLDIIMKAAGSDPELAKKLSAALDASGAGNGNGTGDDGNSTDATGNPFVADLQARWNETSEKEISELIDANPELITDPKLSADVQKWMRVFSNEYKESTGKLMTGGEAMKEAMRHLGIDNKLEKQTLADGAKKHAAPTRPQGGKKKSMDTKPAFTSEQIAMAQMMGHDEAWLKSNAK